MMVRVLTVKNNIMSNEIYDFIQKRWQLSFLNDGNINILKDIHNRTITDFVPPDFREQNSELFVTTVSVRELIAGVTS